MQVAQCCSDVKVGDMTLGSRTYTRSAGTLRQYRTNSDKVGRVPRPASRPHEPIKQLSRPRKGACMSLASTYRSQGKRYLIEWFALSWHRQTGKHQIADGRLNFARLVHTQSGSQMR